LVFAVVWPYRLGREYYRKFEGLMEEDKKLQHEDEEADWKAKLVKRVGATKQCH
jgi:hypothetical protein